MSHHASALLLAALGPALLRHVADSDARSAVCDAVGPLLGPGELADLRGLAGLPRADRVQRAAPVSCPQCGVTLVYYVNVGTGARSALRCPAGHFVGGAR